MQKIWQIVLAAVVVVVITLVAVVLRQPTEPPSLADHTDAALVARGQTVYQQYCAACHGVNLEGESEDWRTVKPSGALPAPPHDDSGHTWHHPDRQLFQMIKYGMERFAPEGWVSDMPAYEEVLSDEEIWAVLAYIKSNWSERALEYQAEREAASRR